MPEILKKPSKRGINLQLFHIFKAMMSVFYFRLGLGNFAESFQSKFIVPRYLRIKKRFVRYAILERSEQQTTHKKNLQSLMVEIYKSTYHLNPEYIWDQFLR